MSERSTDSDVETLIARFMALSTDPYREGKKCDLIDELGAAARDSDGALTLVVEALSDEDVYSSGTSPHDTWFESVADHAYRALCPIAARAEPHIVRLLDRSLQRGDDAARRAGSIFDRTGETCREYSARVLQELPALAPAAIDVLIRCSFDPSFTVQQAVGLALRGQVAAASLIADPATRLVGVIAAPDPPAALLVELLRDPSSHVRIAATRRTRALSSISDDIVAALIACLADQDDKVGHEAASALGEVAPENAAVAEALCTASRRGNSEALYILGRLRPPQLQPLVPELLAWFSSGEKSHDEASVALAGLSDTAPQEVVLAITDRLRALNRETPGGQRPHHLMLGALSRFGRAALPAHREIKRASRHRDPRIREVAISLLAKLRVTK